MDVPVSIPEVWRLVVAFRFPLGIDKLAAVTEYLQGDYAVSIPSGDRPVLDITKTATVR